MGTNIVAAYVSGGRAHEVLAVMDALALSPSDGFEIAFNKACADVASGKLESAEQQLLLAQRLGKPWVLKLCSNGVGGRTAGGGGGGAGGERGGGGGGGGLCWLSLKTKVEGSGWRLPVQTSQTMFDLCQF